MVSGGWLEGARAKRKECCATRGWPCSGRGLCSWTWTWTWTWWPADRRSPLRAQVVGPRCKGKFITATIMIPLVSYDSGRMAAGVRHARCICTPNTTWSSGPLSSLTCGTAGEASYAPIGTVYYDSCESQRPPWPTCSPPRPAPAHFRLPT
ncbi:hypothetical protein IWX90DRAFT_126560 [Phyllosticta citrichinensis]|uniref:Uncharacterized protein n=1 Tax=Phyllosticta citrichinensis TaxID=1130410 RepID=A0ABR1Y404_9PEZI